MLPDATPRRALRPRRFAVLCRLALALLAAATASNQASASAGAGETPLGATLVPGGVQFAVFSEHATRLEVWIFAAPGDAAPSSTHVMSKTDLVNHVWTVEVPGASAGTLYGLRAWGPNWTFDADWTPGTAKADDDGFSSHVDAAGNRFNPNKLLMDPYAKAITGEPTRTVDPESGEAHYDANILGGVDAFAFVDSAGVMPKSIVIDDAFDWGADTAPGHAMKDTVVYEVHVRGFTRAAPDVAPARQGTYAGFGDKAAYLSELGVNAIELLPTHEFLRFDDPVGEAVADRTNYWGYMTMQFFAPNREYLCPDHDSCHFVGGEQVAAFKEMVKALHAEDLEVWLDVVFNHTGEGGGCAGDPVRYWSFRGLDNQNYYTLADDRSCYWDTTGTGNNLNASRPAVRRLILDSLRYWIETVRIDGFRFDLAYTLGREGNDGRDFNANAQTLLDIAQLGQDTGADMVAEAWDAGGFGVGQFPAGWTEWNGPWRDNVRRFQKSDADQVAGLGQSITATRPGFETPPTSINFVTAHDGFTVNDLVSYNEKQNGVGPCNPTGADPNSGSNSNDSWDSGGDEALRSRQVRNFASHLFVHHGVPMLLGGDEMRRTQFGNNNGYMADNSCGWYDWTKLDEHAATFQYFRRLIDFRLAHDALRRSNPVTGVDNDSDGYADIGWHGVLPDTPDWTPSSHTLAFLLDGSSLETGGAQDVPDLYTAYNAFWQDLTFTLPTPPGGACWYLLADTADWAEPIGNIFWDPERFALDADWDQQPLLRVAAATYGLQARSTIHLLARPCAGTEETAVVTFTLDGYTAQPGDELFISGDAPELGAFDPDQALPLLAGDGGTFYSPVAFVTSRGSEIRYRYLVKNGASTTLEDGSPRVLAVPQSGIAYEGDRWNSHLLHDGFESGDTSAWSGVSP